jgi:hypothetical protein
MRWILLTTSNYLQSTYLLHFEGVSNHHLQVFPMCKCLNYSSQSPETPKLESRNCPEIVPGGVPGLWELITPDCEVWSRRDLNQTCSPRQDLSNDVSYSQFGGREEVDSRLLVVGSQTASLTPGPSFAHNLGCRCPNGQCEAIFDI